MSSTFYDHDCPLASPANLIISHQLTHASIGPVTSSQVMMSNYHALVVPSQEVKTVKNVLAADNLLNQGVKIRRHEAEDQSLTEHMTVPLSLQVDNVLDTPATGSIFQKHGLGERLSSYEVITVVHATGKASDTRLNILQCAILDGLSGLHGDTAIFAITNKQHIIASVTPSYVIYKPMLVLPVTNVTRSEWYELLLMLREDSQNARPFFTALASRFDVTHIAINAPIPALRSGDSSDTTEDNLIRSPTNLTPLLGDFGPLLPPYPHHVPFQADFDSAFWVSTRQNGIKQVWAPRYTMFSNGNVTEKARILKLPTVKQSVEQGKLTGTGCTAVDLFSGVGYFAFSYAKAGVSKVLCWDLNPWSIEGLERGATSNKWSCKTLTHVTSAKASPSHIDPVILKNAAKSSANLLAFCETNELASQRIDAMRAGLPPIRHVNCGMLPTAGASWKTAIKIIDSNLGGWIHLHESMMEKDASKRSEAYVVLLQDYYETLLPSGSLSDIVVLEATVKVKSMGPRLWHHVLDFRIPPRPVS